jgi:ankyrin repeat protein
MEDLARYGLELESKEAKTQLRTRCCGFGEEVFEFEGKVLNAIQDPFDKSGRSYLNVELETGCNKGQDLRGYFLRLSAAYGGVGAVKFLIKELGADIHDCNSFGDRALLLAARSGHKDLLIVLLGLGADPMLCDHGDDTPLHWLCSFDDDDAEAVAENLVRHGADINAQENEFPVQGQLQYAETEFVAGTPIHRAICRGKLQAVRTLIRLGAKLDSPARQGIDDTPLALATLLQYPDILAECLSKYPSSESAVPLVTPGGRSLLIPAIQGGSLHRMTIGRLIRHGDQWKKRASNTLALLCEYGNGTV